VAREPPAYVLENDAFRLAVDERDEVGDPLLRPVGDAYPAKVRPVYGGGSAGGGKRGIEQVGAGQLFLLRS
jgi:hypothetical protein